MATNGSHQPETASLVEEASKWKLEGNARFATRNYSAAVDCYEAGLSTIASSSELYEEAQQLRSNLALALIKLSRFQEADSHCSIGLQQPLKQTSESMTTAAKLSYRRAQARESMLDFQNAESDFSLCLTLLSKDRLKDIRDAEEALARVRRKRSEASNNASVGEPNADTTTARLDDIGDHRDEITVDLVSCHDNSRVSLETISSEEGTRANGIRIPFDVSLDARNDDVSLQTLKPVDQQGQQMQQLPSPAQQKNVILKLISQSLNFPEGMSKNGLVYKNNVIPHSQPKEGEAFFLLNIKWWRTWCRYVNFFLEAEYTASMLEQPEGGEQHSVIAEQLEQQRRLLVRLLPPGAILPDTMKENKALCSNMKKKLDDSESSSSTSSSSSRVEREEKGRTCPGVIDNSSLLLDGAKDVFFMEWRRDAQLAANDSVSSKVGIIMADTTHEQNGGAKNQNDTYHLRPCLIRGHHYEILPREAYAALRSWYGERTPSLCRRASLDDDRVLRLVMYPELQYEHIPPGGKIKPNYICSACRSFDARARCTKCMSVVYCGRGCQLSHWVYHKPVCKLLTKKALEAAAACDLRRGALPLSLDHESWGRVGLNNLGNTCFMNSALQCLSHAAPLTRHFLTNRFQLDLNSSNPLGTGGKLAKSYDVVIKELWMGGQYRNVSSINPTLLKRAISVFAPRFAGTAQHDSQEFLAYLLDGLHEDLNRIQNPPYIEMPDVTNRQKMTVAGGEAWDAHCRRNDSLVMDTFYGQFKSTCVCPKCDKVSVSFDAFNHVSLEIPQIQNNQRTIVVFLFRTAGDVMSSLPCRYGVTVAKNACISHVKDALFKSSGIPITRLALCDIYENTICELLNETKSVSTIHLDDTIAAYEVDPYTNRSVHFIAAHTYWNRATDSVGTTKSFFGFPFLSSFDATLSCKDVWNYVWKHVGHLVHDDSVEKDALEDKKSMLQIRIVDDNGIPRPVFGSINTPELAATVSSEVGDARSILPRTLNERLTKYLGSGCVERFLFISLEWCVAVAGNRDKFLEFSDHASLIEEDQRQRALSSNSVTLDRCFETYTRLERLDENNKWYCSSCKEHVRAMKTMELWKLPNVLVIHLKRFEYKHSLRRVKLETFVNFPMEGLDMNKHCAASASAARQGDKTLPFDDNDFVVDEIPAVYDLFAVTNHYGRMGFGHYTAYARRWNENGMDSDWALFDDSSVKSVGNGRAACGEVVSPAAYVLFYRRRIFS